MLYETLQAAFDVAYRGLRAQGFERALRADGTLCAYRGIDGKKCAVGHLIPDEHYHIYLEGAEVSGLGGESKGLWPEHLISALQDLQSVHDSGLSPSRMKQNFARFAREYNLTIPE